MVKDGEGVDVDKLDEAFVIDVKFVLIDGYSEGLEVDILDKAVVFDIKFVLVDRNGEGLEVDVVALNGLEVVFKLIMAVVALGIGPGDVELEVEVLNVLTAGGK